MIGLVYENHTDDSVRRTTLFSARTRSSLICLAHVLAMWNVSCWLQL